MRFQSGFNLGLIQIRTKLVSTLADVKIQSLDALQTTSAAITEVTQNTSELSQSAQTTAVNAFVVMSQFLLAQVKEEAADNDIQESGRYSLFKMYNMFVKFFRYVRPSLL